MNLTLLIEDACERALDRLVGAAQRARACVASVLALLVLRCDGARDSCALGADWPHSRRAGFVYVLTNPGLPGLVKLGWTHGSVESCIERLNAEHVLPFTCVARVRADDAQGIYEDNSRALEAYHVTNNFYRAEADAATMLGVVHLV
jgi:hypothetical protein